MGKDATTVLTAQGLEASDLQANRSGRVTERQVARQAAVRSKGGLGVWLTVAGAVIFGGIGAAKFLANGQPGGAVFMAILALVMAAVPLGIYFRFRFPDPAKVGACKVTKLENAEVGGFLPATNRRGVYSVTLNHRLYSGFATDLRREHLGAHVNAYVVAEHAIVVALEPVD